MTGMYCFLKHFFNPNDITAVELKARNMYMNRNGLQMPLENGFNGTEVLRQSQNDCFTHAHVQLQHYKHAFKHTNT